MHHVRLVGRGYDRGMGENSFLSDQVFTIFICLRAFSGYVYVYICVYTYILLITIIVMSFSVFLLFNFNVGFTCLNVFIYLLCCEYPSVKHIRLPSSMFGKETLKIIIEKM